MHYRLLDKLQYLWSKCQNTHIYKGLTAVTPHMETFVSVESSNITQAILIQILYFNVFFYLLPAIILNYLSNSLVNLMSGQQYSFIIETVLGGLSNIYLFNLIATMFLYNTVLTISATNIAGIQSPDLERYYGKNCDCTQSSKLQQIIKGPLYYLSNHLTAKLISIITHPTLALSLKTVIYGQGLIDGYLANAGACTNHRRVWLAEHNLFALGVGLSFIITQNFSASIVNLIFNFDESSLYSFIVHDSLFNIIWLFFNYNIHLNPSLLSLTEEYSCDLFKYNNKLVDILYLYFKPRVKSLISNITEFKSARRFNFPSKIVKTDAILTSAPVQLFFVQHRASLLTITLWIKRLDSVKFVITSSEWLVSRQRLKLFLTNWFPQSLIDIIFAAINRNYLSTSNAEWLEKYIRSAKMYPLENNLIIILMTPIFNKIVSFIKKIYNSYDHVQELKSFIPEECPAALSSTHKTISLDSVHSASSADNIAAPIDDSLSSPCPESTIINPKPTVQNPEPTIPTTDASKDSDKWELLQENGESAVVLYKTDLLRMSSILPGHQLDTMADGHNATTQSERSCLAGR